MNVPARLYHIRDCISHICLVFRWSLYVLLFFAGYRCLGPLSAKQKVWDLLQTIQACPVLSLFIDPQGVILGSVVKGLSVVFLVWGMAIAAYVLYKERLDQLNGVLAFASLFTGGVATLLLGLFWLFAGAALFGSWNVDSLLGIFSLLQVSVLFGISGLFFRYVAELKFVHSKLFDQYASCLSVFFLLSTMACVICGFLLDIFPYVRLVSKLVSTDT